MLEMYKKVVFSNYANFNGRARRKEYWMFILLHLIISTILNTFLELVLPNLTIIGAIYSFAIFVPSIAVGIRRIHDTGREWWFALIPIYNIILLATEGEKGSNQYGVDPKNELEDISEIGKDLN